MPETSNAGQEPLEETPANTKGIFDDNQPMTYNEVPDDQVDPINHNMAINYLDDKPAVEPEQTLSKSEKAYRELQSKADKDAQALKELQEEQRKYQAQLDDFNAYKPIIRYLEENPQVIDQLANMGKEPTPDKQVAPVEEELIAPTRPSDYDKFAAYNDPESASFKFREQMDEYKLAKMERMEANIDKKTRELEERAVQKEQEFTRRQAEVELNKALARDFQMGEQERRDFIEFSSNPNPSLDVLVNVFRSQRPPAVKDESKEEKQEFKSIVGAPSSKDPNDDLSEEQQFTRNLATRRRNLFETV